MVTWFYFIVFALSAILIVYFMLKNQNVNTEYVLFCAMIFINELGRWLVAASQTLEQAVWAKKVMHIGACYVVLSFALVLMRLCEIYIHRLVRNILVMYSTIVCALGMTIGYTDWYYRSYQLVSDNGYNYLSKEYGPAHYLYTILMIMYIALVIYLIIRAFMNRKHIAFGTVASLGFLAIVIMIIYLLGSIMHSKIEWISVGYLIAIPIISKLFDRIYMYDMTTNIATAVAHANMNGYIVFNKKKQYINSNDMVKQLYPEISSWQIEAVPPKFGSYFSDVIIRWFIENDNIKEHKTARVKGNYYEISVRDITYGKNNRKIGYLMEFIDRTAEHNYTVTVEKYNDELAMDVTEKTAHINHIKDMMVLGMASMVESRDNSTGGHIHRTSSVISIFAKELGKYNDELGLTGDFLDKVERAAPMHDLGKIAVNDVILRKNGKFTDEEYTEMKKHSTEGAKIVRKILAGVEDDDFVAIAENVAHYHHEKWDGNGYPAGIAGEAIPIEARIMALADVFDALVSKRCYKEAFNYDKAFSIIEESLGSHFDPKLGRLFIACRPMLENYYDEINSAEGVEM